MVDKPEPTPRSHEVVVQVLASSINIDDIHAAQGTFYGGIPISPRPRPDRPVIPGSDVAGIVVGTGEGVRSFQAGDAVFGVQIPFRAGGAWAEFCAVDERWLTAKPAQISFAAAASCGVSGLVALSAIRALKLRPGLRVVIVGATGGIGGMAVQMAARAGAEVIGVCGSAHIERAYQLGCALVVAHDGEPWDSVLKARKERVDRVLDLVGGQDIEDAGRHLLPRDGIFVTVVGPKRFIGDHALGWIGVLGTVARLAYRIISSRVQGPRYVIAGPGPGGGKELADVARAVTTGILPPVDSIVPFELEPMRKALRRAASHQNNGRIVIQMNGGLCAHAEGISATSRQSVR